MNTSLWTDLCPGAMYTVTKKIKLHTKPIRTAMVVETGVFVKETPSSLVFKGFAVRKRNIEEIDYV